jgi:hypothetical protein
MEGVNQNLRQIAKAEAPSKGMILSREGVLNEINAHNAIERPFREG